MAVMARRATFDYGQAMSVFRALAVKTGSPKSVTARRPIFQPSGRNAVDKTAGPVTLPVSLALDFGSRRGMLMHDGLLHHAVTHDDHAVRHVGNGLIVGDHQHGGAILLVDFLKQHQDVA